MVSPFRVADPRKAGFFWLPYYSGAGGVQPFLAAIAHIQSAYPFFNASVSAGFPNHIIVQPADYGFASPSWGHGHLDKDLLDQRHIRPGACNIQDRCMRGTPWHAPGLLWWESVQKRAETSSLVRV
jgi:hypothetical protein